MARPATTKATEERGSRPLIGLTARVSESYAAWVQRLQERERLRWGDLVDRALIDYARKVGFEEQVPSRF